jgi:uncharacterized membrane protein YjjP (DUF1212 family)
MAYVFAIVAVVIGSVALLLPGQFIPGWVRRGFGGRALTGLLMSGCGLAMVVTAFWLDHSAAKSAGKRCL